MPDGMMMRLAFFASHGGSGAKAIVEAIGNGTLNAHPAVLFSNNADSKALIWAESIKLPAFVVNKKIFGDNRAADQFTLNTLKENKVTHILLSGYMRKIPGSIVREYPNRIINIHPGLLPEYGGEGMYGRKIHEAVIANNEKETGITIHFVDCNYDTGPVIAQKKIQISMDDTPESLEERVKREEGPFYVDVIKKIESGEIDMDFVARL